MKKKYIVMFSVLILSVVIYICIPKTKEEVDDKTKPNVNTNGFLTLMLEQDDGSYQKTTSNTWPGDGYAFNNELSGCERGGELVYDRETNIVKLISGGSDKCYVYFDKYNVAKITNVTSTKTTNSVTLTVTTEAGENEVDKYYFSKDNRSSYVESSTNTYTFSNLNYGTTYTFKVYAKDTLGYETNEKTVQVTTNAYVNPTVNSITVTDTTTSSISISVSASGGTNSVATYYYSINNGAYSSSSSNTKTFTGLSKGTTYTIKVYVKDTNGVDSEIKAITAITEELPLTFADNCRESGSNTLACYIAKLYTSQGVNGIYYHDANLENGAADNSYRYAGANPNNYVCFGSDVTPCPDDNLYRIIGAFDDNDDSEYNVKLIKAKYIGNDSWDFGHGNIWNNSDIKTKLNTTYYNSLSNVWQNKIATYTWYVGGYSTNSATPKTFYNAESSGTTWIGKIGLIYVSDYGYAASNNYWTLNMNSFYETLNSDWVFIYWQDWTITRNSSTNNQVFFISDEVSIYSSYIDNDVRNYRPAFYLTASTTYVSGSGTSSDPIRIN